MMHQLFGHMSHIFAVLISVPVALVVTALLFACWRWSPIQRVCMPGADECRRCEHLLNAVMEVLQKNGDDHLKPHEYALMAQLSHGILIRNGLNAIALALVFFVVATGSHALLLAL